MTFQRLKGGDDPKWTVGIFTTCQPLGVLNTSNVASCLR